MIFITRSVSEGLQRTPALSLIFVLAPLAPFRGKGSEVRGFALIEFSILDSMPHVVSESGTKHCTGGFQVRASLAWDEAVS